MIDGEMLLALERGSRVSAPWLYHRQQNRKTAAAHRVSAAAAVLYANTLARDPTILQAETAK